MLSLLALKSAGALWRHGMTHARFTSYVTRLFAACLIAATVTIGTFSLTALSAHAQASLASASVREINKQTLDETSIDAPAVSSLSDYTPNTETGTDVPTYPASAIAWIGTDPNHSLNVVTSLDGFNESENKVTLDDNSDIRPAVLLFANKTSGTLAANLVILAWTGTDQNHSLNVMFDVYGVRQKVTLDDNSFASPALAYFNGHVWLAWTGTDPNHSLNIMDMGTNGTTPGQKTILSGAGYSATDGPSLRADTHDNLLLLTWAQHAAPNYIDLAQSSDGVTWKTSFTPPPPQTSGSTPDVLAIPGTTLATLPTNYWAWTGTDALNSLNIAYTSTLNNWPAPIVTLDEQAYGSPALGYSNKLAGGSSHTVTLLLVWTGTDPDHHLNIAVVQIA